jgi:hypothetical protein
VVVFDFDTGAGDCPRRVIPRRTARRLVGLSQDSSDLLAAAVADVLASRVVDDVRALGLSAERAAGAAPPNLNDLVVQGQFVRIYDPILSKSVHAPWSAAAGGQVRVADGRAGVPLSERGETSRRLQCRGRWVSVVRVRSMIRSVVPFLAGAVVAFPISALGTTISAGIESYFRKASHSLSAPMILAIGSADATDFPATSTTAGFSYRFNFDLGEPERIAGPAPPIYTERAPTLGRGRVDLAAGYSYLEFVTLNGTSLSEEATGGPLRTDRFVIAHHIWTFAATYGVTDHLDVNVLVPSFYSVFDARGHLARGQPITSGVEVLGVGDLLLRAKYYVGAFQGVAGAVALDLRVPTGNVDNFQGIGQTTVYPSLIASRLWGRWEGRLGMGVEIDTATPNASRGRYGLGVGVRAWGPFTLSADVIGKSLFVSRTVQEELHGVQFSQQIARTDFLDFIGTVIADVGTHGTFSLGAIVPLNRGQGLRPEVVPTAVATLVF